MKKQDFSVLAVRSWLLLIILTLVTIYVPNFVDNRNSYIFCALFIVVLKGQQIVDVFMELKTAPEFWRLLLLSYIVLLPIVITVIYLI
mgnify:CR=1 FL=1